MTKHKQIEADQENEDWEKLNRELTTRKSIGSNRLKSAAGQSMFGGKSTYRGVGDDEEREEPMFNNVLD